MFAHPKPRWISEGTLSAYFTENTFYENYHKLPHSAALHSLVHIVFREFGSLPATLLARFHKQHADDECAYLDAIDDHLDAGHGELTTPVVADSIVAACCFGDQEFGPNDWYRLCAFVVMPTHIHLLVHTSSRSAAQIVKTIKTHVTSECVKNHQTKLFATGYFDTTMRSEKQFWKVLRYIHMNPVKAQLCADILDWQWSSAKWYV